MLATYCKASTSISSLNMSSRKFLLVCMSCSTLCSDEKSRPQPVKPKPGLDHDAGNRVLRTAGHNANICLDPPQIVCGLKGLPSSVLLLGRDAQVLLSNGLLEKAFRPVLAATLVSNNFTHFLFNSWQERVRKPCFNTRDRVKKPVSNSATAKSPICLRWSRTWQGPAHEAQTKYNYPICTGPEPRLDQAGWTWPSLLLPILPQASC